MANPIGRVVAAGRRVPSMECALACLLILLSLIGNGTGLDGKVRAAVTGAVAGLYWTDDTAVRGVAIPKEAVARAQSAQPFSGVQAQAGRNP